MSSPTNPRLIFLNYRRDESADVTYRLHDALEYALGADTVFVDLNMQPGTPWPQHLRHELDTCRVVLVMVGRDWLKVQDEYGRRRLDQPDDWVRAEIEHALLQGKAVIPVLVRGQTEVPEAKGLPASIQALAERQAIELDARPDRWKEGVRRLLQALKSHGIQQRHSIDTLPQHSQPSFTGVIDYFFRRVGQAVSQDGGKATAAADCIDCRNMRELWQLLDEPSGDLSVAGDALSVRVAGQLSPYAPLLIGHPRHKRRLHLELRLRARQLIEHLGLEFGELLNGLLSYSAGQLVIRPYFRGTKYVYLGLYESIVRNSIPVMVDRPYFETRLSPLFRRQNTLGVTVRGRIGPLENYAKAALDDFGLTERLAPFLQESTLLSVGAPACAIFVSGENGSGIEFDAMHTALLSAPYLDGDIWIANGTNNLLSRFVDIAHREDMLRAVTELVQEAAASRHGRGVLSSFDGQLAAVNDHLPDLVLSAEQLLGGSAM